MAAAPAKLMQPYPFGSVRRVGQLPWPPPADGAHTFSSGCSHSVPAMKGENQIADKSPRARVNAARLVAATFGVLSGFGGIVHGLGEAVQGNVAPSGIIINSWTEGPICEVHGW